MARYYDIVLGLIPVSLFGLSAILFAAGLELTTAVTAGGLLATALVGHGLFVNDPANPPTRRTADDDATPAQSFESAD